MVDQLARPIDKVEVYWFSEQPNGYVRNEDLKKYDATRFVFPNPYFDPEKAHVLDNQYHEQYCLVDEVGFDSSQPGRRRHFQNHQTGQDSYPGECHCNQRPGEDGRRDIDAGLLG